MPVTFLAHQAPVLPLKRWRPELDGIALVVGSAVPDMARVTQDGPALFFFGRPLWFDGHRPDQIVSWCLVIGLLLTWSARRLVLPRLAGCLPDAGAFHLRDLRLVGRTRHPWWMVALCVLIGSVTHVLLDLFTHSDRTILLPGLDIHVVDVAGRSLDVANVLQVVLSVGLSVFTVWQMWQIGRERLVARWSGADPSARGPVARQRGQGVVRAAVVVAAMLTGALAATQLHRSPSIALMTWVFLGWGALCVIAVFVPRPAET